MDTLIQWKDAAQEPPKQDGEYLVVVVGYQYTGYVTIATYHVNTQLFLWSDNAYAYEVDTSDNPRCYVALWAYVPFELRALYSQHVTQALSIRDVSDSGLYTFVRFVREVFLRGLRYGNVVVPRSWGKIELSGVTGGVLTVPYFGTRASSLLQRVLEQYGSRRVRLARYSLESYWRKHDLPNVDYEIVIDGYIDPEIVLEGSDTNAGNR